jgi:phosphoesterase RecJ-like protein
MQRIPPHALSAWKETITLCHQAKTVAILWHRNPDGDAIGSAMALAQRTTAIGCSSSIYFPTDVAPILTPFIDSYSTKLQNKNYDLILCVDSASTQQLWSLRTMNNDSMSLQQHIITIDHHPTNTWYWTTNILDPLASSTCELIAELMLNSHPESITPAIATSLLLWIITDTGNFQYEQNSQRTFTIVTALIEAWWDKNEIIQTLYRAHSIQKIQYLGVLLQRIEKKWPILYAWLSNTECIHHNIPEDIADLFIGLFTTIQHPWIFITCKLDYTLKEIRCSLRSKSDERDVSQIATFFGWWGHKRAAGIKFPLDTKKDAQTQIDEIITSIRTSLT